MLPGHPRDGCQGFIAVREIALGTGLAASSRGDGNPYAGLITLSLIDAGEAVILLLALNSHEMARGRGWAFIAADAGSALAGAGAMTATAQDARTGRQAPLMTTRRLAAKSRI